MTFKKYLIDKLKEKERIKKVLFIDSSDKRARDAATLHAVDGIIIPVLLVEKKDEKLAEGIEQIVMSDWSDKIEELSEKYVEIRKGKENIEQARNVLQDPVFFAMMMLHTGEVDGVIGGLVNPTSDILRGAFKVIGPKAGVKTISSVMLMERAHEWYIFTDISVNPDPTVEALSDIASNASDFARFIDFKTKVAFLSFSTSSSAVHPMTTKIREATVMFNEKYKPEYTAIGEVQFDAAFSPDVRKSKYKDDGFKKNPTIFVFPDLNSGNIGYKIAQRMAGFGAIGPIITGVAKPVNDLSRGSTREDVYNTAIITALQADD